MSVHNAARCRKDKPLEDQSRNRVENQSRNKKGHAPAALVRLALAAALVLSWPGLLPGGLPGAQAEEPPGAATTIIEFERDNPVFSWSAEAGTPREHLPLPATVRALCPLPASQGEGFAQTLPVPDDDGDYDYYWYGYVAPRGAEALHAAGQPAVYTIYDADGRDAYRLHGTYDGANEGFYACDEQGNLTAAVVEVPVTWRGTYDAAKAENYDFIAKIEGFAFEGDAPTARIALISQESLQAAEAASNSGCCGEGLAEGSCPGTEGCTHGAALALHDTDAAPAGGADDAVYETDGPDGVDAVPAGDVVYEDGGLGDADDTYGADGPEAGMAASLEDAVAACSCGQEASGHAQGCPLWVDLYPGCTCPDGPSGHTDAGCPYFVPLADCACGIDAVNLPCQHDAGCPLWGPADCGCEGAAHDPGNRDCMLYSPVASLPGGISPLGLGDVGGGISIMPLGIGDDGSAAFNNDREQDRWMYRQAPTNENRTYYNAQYGNTVRLPPTWTAYVNTIWHNKGVNRFEWTPAADTNAYNGWAWGGMVANQNTQTVQTNALRTPAIVGGNIDVYSGEQLRWALSSATGHNTTTTAFTIRLMGNINLNGSAQNWGLVQRLVAGTVTLTSGPGGPYTIYNMGIFRTEAGPTSNTSTTVTAREGNNTGGGASTGLYNSTADSANGGSQGARRNFENFSMETCKVAAVARGARTRNGNTYNAGQAQSGVSTLGDHAFQWGTVNNVHVRKSLVFGDRAEWASEANHPTDGNGLWSTLGSQLFMTGLSLLPTTTTNASTISNCSVEGGYVYGREHVISFMRGIRTGTVSNCYAADNLICGTAQHSAAFMSCGTLSTGANQSISITNCFASSEMYGSLQVSGFIAYYDPPNITNCYATGKLEGYQYLGGFYAATNSNNAVAIQRCYSTVLVGLRTGPVNQGGFYVDMYNGTNTPGAVARDRDRHVLRDVYAAGEVGNYDLNVNADGRPVRVGGFASAREDLSRIITANGSDTPNNRIQYCYYDKQTTAMREWTVGAPLTGSTAISRDYMAPTGTAANTAYNGVRGVLTSTTDKAGTGLASGTWATDVGDRGFRGFSTGNRATGADTHWAYEEEHYPQLMAFSDANTRPYNATTNPGGGWLAADLEKVKAWSKASTATVILDTWDKGWDWTPGNTNAGVRSADEVPYDRASTGTDHRGGTLTYDTVRDIISDFDTTYIAANSTEWRKLVTDGGDNHGALSWVAGPPDRPDDERKTTDHIAINDGVGHVSIKHPGLDWYEVAETLGAEEGHRPLRVIAYMSVYAGKDRVLAPGSAPTDDEDVVVVQGETYDHRPDVELAMMDALADNLVVGMNMGNNGIINAVNAGHGGEPSLYPADYNDYDMLWSRSIDQPYPRTAPNTSPVLIPPPGTQNPTTEQWMALLQGAAAANTGSASDRYYEVRTDHTNFPVGNNAWVNTDIRRVEKAPDPAFDGYRATAEAGGGVVPSGAPGRKPDVKSGDTYLRGDVLLAPANLIGVVGPGTGTGTATLDECMWNGMDPLYTGYASEQKYLVTYYWVLADGRYRSDTKIVTVIPPEYDLTVRAWNMDDGSPNSTALVLDAARDSGGAAAHDLAGAPSHEQSLPDNPQATSMSGAWKGTSPNVSVKKVVLTMTAPGRPDRTVELLTPDGLAVGDEITIPLDYFYLAPSTALGSDIATLTEAPAQVTYTVMADAQGGLYLHFNKMANAPADEEGALVQDKDGTGIAPAAPAAPGVPLPYVNDIGYNIEVDLYVELDEANELVVEKNLAAPADREETFVFRVEYRGAAASPGAVERTMFAVITIPAGGDYGSVTFTGMDPGWYTVTELDSNWTYTLLGDRLGPDNALELDGATPRDPAPTVSAPDRDVSMWSEGSGAWFTFWNERDDVPWVFDKARTTNDMPQLTGGTP